MPAHPCLYAVISGADSPVSLEAPKSEENHAGQQHALGLLGRLRELEVKLLELRPPRLPLVCEHVDDDEEGNIFGYWLTRSECTVDTLVGLQAVRKTDRWINILHRGGRTCGDETLCLMGQAGSIDRSLAILGSALGEEAIHSSYERPDAPWERDPDQCKKIVAAMRVWAAEEVPQAARGHFYGNKVLFQTPFTMSRRPTNNIEKDFLDHIAARIAHCLKGYRPVLLHRVKDVPSEMVATLMNAARQEKISA